MFLSMGSIILLAGVLLVDDSGGRPGIGIGIGMSFVLRYTGYCLY